MFIAHVCHFPAKRFILCYHKDWFHICNSNVVLAHPHLFLCLPNDLSQQSLLCIIPGVLLPLWVFCKLAFFFTCSFSLILPVCCLLACTFTALEMGLLHSSVGPYSRVPCSFLSPLCCTDSTGLMLSQPYKMIHYITPLLSPSSVFNFSAWSVWFGLQAPWVGGMLHV